MSNPKSLATILATSLAVVSAGTLTELAVADTGFSVTPGLGIYKFDDDLDIEDEVFGSIGLQYQFNQNAAIEASWGTSDTENKYGPTSDVEWTYAHVDALYYFNPGQRLRPYLAAGAGEGRFEFNNTDKVDETLLNIGGGIKYLFADAVAVRADLRAVNSTDNETTSGLASVSLSYLFGGTGDSSTSTPDFEIGMNNTNVLPDDDEDGIANVDDQCINTPVGIQVDGNGCAIDADLDGIADYQDQCINTASGVQVNEQGCALDLDRDGIADYQDSCLDTQIGALVDQQGCPINLSDIAPKVPDAIFATGSSELEGGYLKEVEAIATFLNRYENTVAVIEGHTDSTGDAAFNTELSKQRAASIEKILVEQFKVDPSRLKVVGFGESKPIASNTTSAGRAQNRRVITKIETVQ